MGWNSGVKEMELLDLARRLPEGDEDEHIERLEHCITHGNIITIEKDGRTAGYAELYRMELPPQYPVWPYPEDKKYGRYLYCYAAVCEKGLIKKLMNLAKETFPECFYLCYHRNKHRNKLYIERMARI